MKKLCLLVILFSAQATVVSNEDTEKFLESCRDEHDVTRLNELFAKQERADELANCLFIASGHGNLEAVKLLIETKNIDPTSAPKSAAICNRAANVVLKEACSGGHLGVVDYLLNIPKVKSAGDLYWALVAAAIEGHVEVVKALISKANVKPTEFEGHAIHSAISFGQLEVIKYLVTLDSIDIGMKKMMMYWAVESGKLEIVKYVVGQGVDPRTHSCNLLQLAVENGDEQVTRYLIDEIHLQPSRFDCALSAAVESGKLSVVRLICENFQVDPSFNDNELIRASLSRFHYDMAKYLLSDPRTVLVEHQNKDMMLHVTGLNEEILKACVSTDLDALIALLSKDKHAIDNLDIYIKRASKQFGFDKNTHALNEAMNELLLDACSKGELSKVKGLCQLVKDPPPACLARACEADRLETVKYLVEEVHVDPSADNNDAFVKACCGGATSVVEYLLNQAGVDPTAKLSEALVAAAGNGHLSLVQLLLTIDKADLSEGANAAFDAAARNDHLDVMNLLFDDKIGETKLQAILKAACDAGQQGVVNFVLEKGAKLVDDQGVCVPLESAARKGHIEIIKTIIDHLTRRGMKTQELLDRALILAAQKDDFEAANLLLGYGADPSVNSDEILKSAIQAKRSQHALFWLADPRTTLRDCKTAKDLGLDSAILDACVLADTKPEEFVKMIRAASPSQGILQVYLKRARHQEWIAEVQDELAQLDTSGKDSNRGDGNDSSSSSLSSSSSSSEDGPSTPHSPSARRESGEKPAILPPNPGAPKSNEAAKGAPHTAANKQAASPISIDGEGLPDAKPSTKDGDKDESVVSSEEAPESSHRPTMLIVAIILVGLALAGIALWYLCKGAPTL